MKKIILVLSFLLCCVFANAQIQIGDTISNIKLTNAKGVETNLLTYKSKLLLIDFWASWCAPCRVANRKLEKLYQTYQDKGFAIVGISLDMKQEQFLAAVKKDKVTYPQFIEPKGWDAKSAEAFGVEALPASFVVDETGKIIAINPSEEQLNNHLKSLK